MLVHKKIFRRDKFMLDVAEKFFGRVRKVKVGMLAKSIVTPALHSKLMPIH